MKKIVNRYLSLALGLSLHVNVEAVDKPDMHAYPELHALREMIDGQPIVAPNAPIPQFNAALTQLLFERFPVFVLGRCRQVSWRWNNYILALPGRKFYCLKQCAVDEETNPNSGANREVFGKFELPFIDPLCPISLNLLSINDAAVMKEILPGILRSHKVKLVLVRSKKEVVDAVVELEKSFPVNQQFLIAFSPPFWDENIRSTRHGYAYGDVRSQGYWGWDEPPKKAAETFTSVLHLTEMPKISIYVLLRNIASQKDTALGYFTWFKNNKVNPGILGVLARVCHTRDFNRNSNMLSAFAKFDIKDRTPIAKMAAAFVNRAIDIDFIPLIRTLSKLDPETQELISKTAPAIFTYNKRVPLVDFPMISAQLCEVIHLNGDKIRGINVAGFIHYFRLLYLYGQSSGERIAPRASQNLTQPRNFTTFTANSARAYVVVAGLIEPITSLQVYDALEGLCLKYGRNLEKKLMTALHLYFTNSNDTLEVKLSVIQNLKASRNRPKSLNDLMYDKRKL